MHKLDHVVIAANNLDEGTSYVENKLNVKLSDIGYHRDCLLYTSDAADE